MLLKMIYAGFPFFTGNVSSIAAALENNNTIHTEGKGQRVQKPGKVHEPSKSAVQPLEGLLTDNAALESPRVAQEPWDCDTEDLAHCHT